MLVHKIPLKNKNKEIVGYALVDEDDYEKVNKIKWYLGQGYVLGCINKNVYRMHRFIMNAEKGQIVDHINGDKIDNRKSNLRFVTSAQNSQNRPKTLGCSSKYFGVSYHKKTKKWVCFSGVNQVLFSREEHAAYWHDQLALREFGDGAKINGISRPENFVEPVKKENTKTLPKGVFTSGKRFRARIRYEGKWIHLGTFDTISEAENKYNSKLTEIESLKENEYKNITRNQNNNAVLYTAQKAEILVDDDKYVKLVRYSWNKNTDGYVQAKVNGKHVLMHRYLLGANTSELVDHINNNRLDNRISNLRIVDASINSHNKLKSVNTTSKYKGVSYKTTEKKYVAQIGKDGVKYSLGTYKIEEEAAKAYDKKALELYGEGAKLNFGSSSNSL